MPEESKVNEGLEAKREMERALWKREMEGVLLLATSSDAEREVRRPPFS